MSFDVVVTSFDAMWLLVLRHVTWCIDELLTIVPRNRMECYELKMPLVVRSLRVVQGVTMWWSKGLLCTTPVLLCTTKNYSSDYSVLQSTTLYYKVLRQYYNVLLCTTKYYASTTTYYSSTTLYYKVLQCTTQYYNVLLQYYSKLQSTTPVLQSTTRVLLCTTKYYASTTQYYKVLLQYYSVLQSTTPVLLCTTQNYNVLLCTTKCYASATKYYSSTILYQHTTPVLLCTTKYYASTTTYYPVLQRTTPVLLCTTKYYSSTTLYYASTTSTTLYYKVLLSSYYSGTTLKCHLHCAEQQEAPSNFTKYCACHAKWISWLIGVTYEATCTIRGATRGTL